jgi:hypothetical protein
MTGIKVEKMPKKSQATSLRGSKVNSFLCRTVGVVMKYEAKAAATMIPLDKNQGTPAPRMRTANRIKPRKTMFFQPSI